MKPVQSSDSLSHTDLVYSNKILPLVTRAVTEG